MRSGDDMPIITKTQKRYKLSLDRLFDKSQGMRISRRNDSLRIKVDNRELKEFGHLNTLEVLNKRCFCTREIKKRIAIAEEAFKRKTTTLDKQAKH